MLKKVDENIEKKIILIHNEIKINLIEITLKLSTFCKNNIKISKHKRVNKKKFIFNIG
jgi:hypothetical protein